jgi:hypothetical protein
VRIINLIMKRKLFIMLVPVLLITISCGSVRYNKVYSYEDEFRGSSRKYLRIVLKDDERRNEIGDARVILESSHNENDHSLVAYFAIPRASSSFRADGSGYIKAGEDKFEIPLMDPVSEVKMKTEESISTFTSSDSTGVSTTATASSDTQVWIEEKFMLKLSEEHKKSILQAGGVIFRFYFGPVPATYLLRGKKLELIKEVLR